MWFIVSREKKYKYVTYSTWIYSMKHIEMVLHGHHGIPVVSDLSDVHGDVC